MYVSAGQPFTATLLDPGGLDQIELGARIEVPATRAIVGMWTPAVLNGDVWSVTMDAPPAAPASQVTYALGESPILTAELAAGEFNLVWMDGGEPPALEIFVPLLVSPSGDVPDSGVDFPDADPAAVRPAVADVGALERIRTVDRGGNTIGTFTDETTPTDTVVESYIDDAVDMVLVQLREQFDSRHNAQVKRAIALQAALLVESSDYPESNEPDAARKERMLQTLITSIQARIADDYEQAYVANSTAARLA